MTSDWRRRQLLLMGREIRLDNSEFLPQSLTETTEGERCRGRPFRAAYSSFVHELKLIIMSIDKRRDSMKWV